MMAEYLICYKDENNDIHYVESYGETATEAIHDAYAMTDIREILGIYAKI